MASKDELQSFANQNRMPGVGLVNRIVSAVKMFQPMQVKRWLSMLPDLQYFMKVSIDLVVYKRIPKIGLFNRLQ